MTKTILTTAASAAIFSVTAFAGEPVVAPSKGYVAPTPLYGVGWYAGLQLGINAYQDYGGARRFDVGDNDIAIDNSAQIGFVGGLKLGYVFGTDFVRPAIEADLFYNGVRGDLDVRVNGEDTDFNADGNIHSGAGLVNFLLRFNFDRFQPYFGGGVGGYYAEVDDVDVTIRGRDFDGGGGGGNSGFAWQLIAGADYYFNEKTSLFLEYKFLNYEDAGVNEDRIGQQIVVLGVRWHF